MDIKQNKFGILYSAYVQKNSNLAYVLSVDVIIGRNTLNAKVL